jgi:hypothetical protein
MQPSFVPTDIQHRKNIVKRGSGFFYFFKPAFKMPEIRFEKLVIVVFGRLFRLRVVGFKLPKFAEKTL